MIFLFARWDMLVPWGVYDLSFIIYHISYTVTLSILGSFQVPAVCLWDVFCLCLLRGSSFPGWTKFIGWGVIKLPILGESTWNQTIQMYGHFERSAHNNVFFGLVSCNDPLFRCKCNADPSVFFHCSNCRWWCLAHGRKDEMCVPRCKLSATGFDMWTSEGVFWFTGFSILNIHDTLSDSGHCCWKILMVFQDSGCFRADLFGWHTNCTLYSVFFFRIFLHRLDAYLPTFYHETSTIHVGKYSSLMDGANSHRFLTSRSCCWVWSCGTREDNIVPIIWKADFRGWETVVITWDPTFF